MKFGRTAAAASLGLFLFACTHFDNEMQAQQPQPGAPGPCSNVASRPAVSNSETDLRRSSDQNLPYPCLYTFRAWAAARGNDFPDPAIVLSFSGGFLHAAGLANGVLQELRRYTIRVCSTPGNPTSCRSDPLLEHVVAIASTSGGGFANVNYTLRGAEGLDTFETDFLQKNLAGALLTELGKRPWKIPNTFGPFAERASLMVDTLNHAFPRTPTAPGDNRSTYEFQDLSPERPFAIFGATDYDSERYFTFTQKTFADICSDLSTYPLMDAVTASGAFPLLLTDIELKNHQVDSCPQAPSAPPPVLGTAYTDEPVYLDQRYSYALQHSGTDPGPVEPFHPETYIHLFDGGIADNLAVRPIMLDVLNSQNFADIFANKTILYVQVNARSDPDAAIARHLGSANLVSLAVGVPYASIDSMTAMSDYAAHSYWNYLFEEHNKPANRTNPFPSAMYFAEIDYDQYLAAKDAEHPGIPPSADDFNTMVELKSLSGVSLSPKQIADLRAAASVLLTNHPCFARFRARFDLHRQGDGLQAKPVANVEPGQENCLYQASVPPVAPGTGAPNLPGR